MIAELGKGALITTCAFLLFPFAADIGKIALLTVALGLLVWFLWELALDAFHADTGLYPTKREGLRALVVNPGIPRWGGPYISEALRRYIEWFEYSIGADGKPVLIPTRQKPLKSYEQGLGQWSRTVDELHTVAIRLVITAVQHLASTGQLVEPTIG